MLPGVARRVEPDPQTWWETYGHRLAGPRTGPAEPPAPPAAPPVAPPARPAPAAVPRAAAGPAAPRPGLGRAVGAEPCPGRRRRRRLAAAARDRHRRAG